MGAVEQRRVPHRARSIHRARHDSGGRGDRPQARAFDLGGTSDARFIKNYCPVIEFGLVGQTMHQVDERVATADVVALTAIYRRILDRYFA